MLGSLGCHLEQKLKTALHASHIEVVDQFMSDIALLQTAIPTMLDWPSKEVSLPARAIMRRTPGEHSVPSTSSSRSRGLCPR